MECVGVGITVFSGTQLESLHWQVHLKDVLTAIVTRRKAYRLRDGHFPYAFGSDVTPQPYLKNSLAAYHSVIEW